MGCSNSSEKDDDEQMRSYRNKNNSFSSNDNISESSNEFKDFEEYNNKYIGEGIKRIKSYKCPMPYNKLNELREKFWKSKKTNKYIRKINRESNEKNNVVDYYLVISFANGIFVKLEDMPEQRKKMEENAKRL